MTPRASERRVTPARSAGRRIPRQTRARLRVTAILDAAAELVTETGVDHLTTRSVAERADMAPASLYQYFADRDAILLALIGRAMEEADREVARVLAEFTDPDLESVVTATVEVYLRAYRARPSFTVAYLRGRTNPAIARFSRHHNARLARDLYEFGRDTGMLLPTADLRHVRLAIEVADQIFRYAFGRDLEGDDFVVGEGLVLMTGYLRPHIRGRG